MLDNGTVVTDVRAVAEIINKHFIASADYRGQGQTTAVPSDSPPTSRAYRYSFFMTPATEDECNSWEQSIGGYRRRYHTWKSPPQPQKQRFARLQSAVFVLW
ncbi:hypothetical protein J6590_022841 [Homalodisca vitripennis]|nr:hypothetical protein J6590_022841 [Homalodisca vitripennis]